MTDTLEGSGSPDEQMVLTPFFTHSPPIFTCFGVYLIKQFGVCLGSPERLLSSALYGIHIITIQLTCTESYSM